MIDTDLAIAKNTVELPPRLTPADLRSLDTSNDPNELIRHRFLCRGGGLLFVGATGIGKSSAALQMAVCHCLGRDFMGITPQKPLQIAMIQAENDSGDMAEMLQGVEFGMDLADHEKEALDARLSFYRESTRTGPAFIDILRCIIHEDKLDMVYVDPAFAFLGGDASAQTDVGYFLRNSLNPVLSETGTAAVILHHKNKPREGNGDTGIDSFAYAGAGSAEWANWPRGVICLDAVADTYGTYRMIAAKRGRRIGWTDHDGSNTCKCLIRHDDRKGIICWHKAEPQPTADIDQAEAAVQALNDSVLPTTDAIQAIREATGLGEKKARKLKGRLIDEGRLIEHRETKKNASTYVGSPDAIAALKDRIESIEFFTENS